MVAADAAEHARENDGHVGERIAKWVDENRRLRAENARLESDLARERRIVESLVSSLLKLSWLAETEQARAWGDDAPGETRHAGIQGIQRR